MITISSSSVGAQAASLVPRWEHEWPIMTFQKVNCNCTFYAFITAGSKRGGKENGIWKIQMFT